MFYRSICAKRSKKYFRGVHMIRWVGGWYPPILQNHWTFNMPKSKIIWQIKKKDTIGKKSKGRWHWLGGKIINSRKKIRPLQAVLNDLKHTKNKKNFPLLRHSPYPQTYQIFIYLIDVASHFPNVTNNSHIRWKK